MGLLGSGAMGTVYKVRDVELDEVVALKRLRPGVSGSLGALERFRQEVKLARRVTHPNVVRTFDLGEAGEERFLTMEYVHGSPLSQILKTQGALSAPHAIALTLQLCAGLSAAHSAGVLHRDLKPDNILLTPQGRAMITDFGIARAVVPGGQTSQGLMGTPAYMAPEQVEPDGRIDARADQYALGAMLYELLTGRVAWPGVEVLTVALARLTEPPPDPRKHRPDLPEGLAQLIMRCMARAPEARFPDIDAVAQALAAQSGSAPTLAPETLPTHRRPSAGAEALAVLPLTFHDPADQWIADGLTEELIDALSMTPGLRVRPLTAVRDLVHRDPRNTGLALGVGVVVTGSVRRVEEQIRLSIRLLHVGDGYQLWARRATTPASTALALSDTLAQEIAQALAVRLQGPQRAQAEDPIAVELYLKGRAAIHRNWHADLTEAVGLLTAALERAPHHPSILAAYASARARQSFYQATAQQALLDEALDAAQEAVARGPDLGEPWMALANVRLYRMDSRGAYQAVRTALVRAPGIARAHELLGILLLEAGRLDEAEASLLTALSVDPGADQSRWELARLYALRGQWTQADRMVQVPPSADSDNVYAYVVTRLRLDFWRNRRPQTDATPFQEMNTPRGQLITQSIELLDLLVTKDIVHPQFMAYISLRIPQSDGRQRVLLRQVMVEVACRAGDLAEAERFLEEAIAEGLQDLAWLDHCPLLAPARGQPRWQALRQVVADRAARLSEPEPTR